MGRMKTLLTAFAIALWSLPWIGAWLLLGPTIAFLDAQVDWLAAWPALLYWTRAWLGLLGQIGAVVLGLPWALGVLGILGIATCAPRLWQRVQRRPAAVS